MGGSDTPGVQSPDPPGLAEELGASCESSMCSNLIDFFKAV